MTATHIPPYSLCSVHVVACDAMSQCVHTWWYVYKALNHLLWLYNKIILKKVYNITSGVIKSYIQNHRYVFMCVTVSYEGKTVNIHLIVWCT